MNRAQMIVDVLLETDSLDSMEGGKGVSTYPFGGWPRKPDWHEGHRSSRMALNRTNRAKSFGSTARYSMRDRGWPYANRNYDFRQRKYEREIKKHGQVRPGEGI